MLHVDAVEGHLSSWPGLVLSLYVSGLHVQHFAVRTHNLVHQGKQQTRPSSWNRHPQAGLRWTGRMYPWPHSLLEESSL